LENIILCGANSKNPNELLQIKHRRVTK